MSEMLERVALAFREQTKVEDWEELKALARIAITAMREPTDRMIRAGRGGTGYDRDCIPVWRDMIEVALRDDDA